MKKRMIILLLAAIIISIGVLYFVFRYKEGLSPSGWDNIDCIYYINIAERTDRNKEFLNEMKKYDVPDSKIVRIDAVYDKQRGALGCTKSHIKTLQQFINSGYKNCIIFEDDFEFSMPKDYVTSSIQNFFSLNIPYDVVMLSANDLKFTNSQHSGLSKAIDVQTTAGYMISSDFAKILLDNFMTGSKLLEKSYSDNGYDGSYAVDMYWKQLQPNSKWYIFDKKLGKQRESYSDIENRSVKYGV
jgi:GR25 family glycosyltransferase involved in LPS biosynthesis